MAEQRIGRGWSDSELEVRLARLDDLETGFDETSIGQMTTERGWRPERSRSLLARERPGPPEPDGFFERACAGIADYQFSDPQIVVGHFVPHTPLLGRRMLLELKVLGLHYLCGVVVGEVIDERTDERTCWGFRYDTLEGHLEEGSEWFEVVKDHASGQVWFCVRSRWRRGQFPNWWSELGFALLSGRYRALWLRRGHERLRELIQLDTAALKPKEEPMTHRGTQQIDLGHTGEHQLGQRDALIGAAGAGILAGMRSISAPALLAARAAVTGPQPGDNRFERTLARPGAAAVVAMLAAGELVVDKLPSTPARTTAPVMTARLVSGGLSGWLIGRKWRHRPWAFALTGVAAAGASTLAAYELRRRAHEQGLANQVTLGLIEDGLVIAGAALLWRFLKKRSPAAYEATENVEREAYEAQVQPKP